MDGKVEGAPVAAAAAAPADVREVVGPSFEIYTRFCTGAMKGLGFGKALSGLNVHRPAIR